MQPLMPNIKRLRDDMREKGWVITAFPFKYKQISYIVICERLLDDRPKKDKIWIVKLTFEKIGDEDNKLTVMANSYSFDIDIRTLRAYFNIRYRENLGNLFIQFYNLFQRYIPYQAVDIKNEDCKKSMVRYLNRLDGEEGMYLFALKRNPKIQKKQYQRTYYNSDKTRLLRPNIYELFKRDKTVSFCYSTNKDQEKSDQDLIIDFQNR